MKRKFFILYLWLFCFVTCKKDAYPYLILGIDLQSGFNHDKVQVFIDNDLITDNTFTTMAILGVCNNGTFKTEKLNGSYTIKVIINGQIMKTEVIHLNKNKYLGVSIDYTNHQVNFMISETPFLYE